MKRDLRRVLDEARQAGWLASPTRGGHWRLTHPSGAILVTGSTPSDHRALRNLQAAIRRATHVLAAKNAQEPRQRPRRQSRRPMTVEPPSWTGEPVAGLRVAYGPDGSRTWTF